MPISPLRPETPVAGGARVVWEGLPGCSKALALAAAARGRDAPFVVVTADQSGARRLMEELAFFNPPGPGVPLLPFPDWETLPYDRFSPYQDIISERLATLVALRNLRAGILVVTVSTLMQRLPPADYLHAHSLALRTGQTLDVDAFRQELGNNGYRNVSQVMEHGDVAVRGSIIDVYPMGSQVPFRLDLFDRELDSIRTFDIETQRSLEQVREVKVLPAREVPLTDAAIELFRSNWRQRFPGNPGHNPIYADVSNGIAPAGVEYYLPLFYTHTGSLRDYFPSGVCVVLDEGVSQAARAFHELARGRYEQGQHDAERPLLSPDEIFYQPDEVLELLTACPQIHIGDGNLDGSPGTGTVSVVRYRAGAPQKYPINARAPDPLALLRGFMQAFAGRVLLVAESLGRRETIVELFQGEPRRPVLCKDWDEFLDGELRFGLTVAPLERGATLAGPDLAIISETQLFGERVQQRRLRKRRRPPADSLISNLGELSVGAPVVHEEHGVGRYLGLDTLTVNGVATEFICLEYDRGDKLYVPVTALDQVSRFVGTDAEQAPLHRLGSGHWLKARQKALKRVYDVAAELLALHARRAAMKGHQSHIDNTTYQAFAQDFPFEETPGQAEAIAGVLEDLRAETPMDRLVCGDSGFGKTEVAMRAAFVVVENHKQVAVLAPTTLLAQQHYRNFSDRFADWPVRLAALSRFVSPKEQAGTRAGLRSGNIDIVIGTHRLLQADVAFRDLGLVIIDEEHRFGVRQKEKLKSLRAQADILTLTATPIPRTLNLALTDLQSLSVIATPPSRRLPVKVFTREWDETWLAEAMLRELKRGGQVYFVHNEISSIGKIADQVAALAPEARLRVAHGQMPEQQLEQVMLDFYHQRCNVLVCTTIIETGIDVPSANTIIINRAHKFGLAQLYQLRGRVGRSHHRAYAYLVKPGQGALSEDAARRFEAIESLEELGTGFTLAAHDMEIRGVGEILGDEQSGHVQEVGFGLYMNLLERAVSSLKAGRQPELDRPLDHGTEIDLHVPALIPSDYLPDVHTRLLMYKRIAGAGEARALQDLQEEYIDRFGLLPEALKNLFRIARLKQRAAPLGISKIDLGVQGGRIQFNEDAEFDRERLLRLVQAAPDSYRFAQGGSLKITRELADATARFCFLDGFLDDLAGAQDTPLEDQAVSEGRIWTSGAPVKLPPGQ